MNPSPLVLAFDTSAAHCSAALLAGETLLASAHEDMGKGQAERLMLLLEEVLEAGDVSYSDLSAIGVGTGPGNFTGIRIAVSAARGLALGLGIPAIGITTFEAQALGSDGPILSTVDARRDSVYLQGFGYAPTDGPEQHPLDALPATARHPGLTVIGGRSEAVAQILDARATAPAFPLAEAIARLAASRLGQDLPRAKPLYVRQADAAPSRDPVPIILP